MSEFDVDIGCMPTRRYADHFEIEGLASLKTAQALTEASRARSSAVEVVVHEDISASFPRRFALTGRGVRFGGARPVRGLGTKE
jgi:hypothetical protein